MIRLPSDSANHRVPNLRSGQDEQTTLRRAIWTVEKKEREIRNPRPQADSERKWGRRRCAQYNSCNSAESLDWYLGTNPATANGEAMFLFETPPPPPQLFPSRTIFLFLPRPRQPGWNGRHDAAHTDPAASHPPSGAEPQVCGPRSHAAALTSFSDHSQRCSLWWTELPSLLSWTEKPPRSNPLTGFLIYGWIRSSSPGKLLDFFFSTEHTFVIIGWGGNRYILPSYVWVIM